MAAFTTLKRRADFLAAAASGIKFVKPSVVVQARWREAQEPDLASIRVGFTATRKLGNAVIRNRAKRRMRAAAAQTLGTLGVEGCDYVFIGREACYKGSYDGLIRDLKHALKRLADQLRKERPLPSDPSL